MPFLHEQKSPKKNPQKCTAPLTCVKYLRDEQAYSGVEGKGEKWGLQSWCRAFATGAAPQSVADCD